MAGPCHLLSDPHSQHLPTSSSHNGLCSVSLSSFPPPSLCTRSALCLVQSFPNICQWRGRQGAALSCKAPLKCHCAELLSLYFTSSCFIFLAALIPIGSSIHLLFIYLFSVRPTPQCSESRGLSASCVAGTFTEIIHQPIKILSFSIKTACLAACALNGDSFPLPFFLSQLS